MTGTRASQVWGDFREIFEGSPLICLSGAILYQMVKCLEADLDGMFGALGEPVRRAVVRQLASGEKSLSALAKPFDMTMPAVMKHVAILERSGIIRTEKRGRTRYCALEPAKLKLAQDWISEMTYFWTSRIESLKRHVEEDK